MKLTLEQAYERATKGPIASVPQYKIYGHCITGGAQGETMIAAVGSLGESNAESKVNGAILAHAFNVLPEVVEALEACLNRLAEHDEQSAPECLQASAALAKASTVEAPQ